MDLQLVAHVTQVEGKTRDIAAEHAGMSDRQGVRTDLGTSLSIDTEVEFGRSVEEAADKFGISEPTAATDLRLTRTDAAREVGMSDRQQKSAIRRAGELLQAIDGRGGDKIKTVADHGFAFTQRQAAADAGMSEHQHVQVKEAATDRFHRNASRAVL
jgi:hypothetical protein